VRHNWLLFLALCVALAGLIYGTTVGALWDPHEVTVAELSRRIALNLLGGKALALPGADNTVPIRSELGRGELPFTSAALGLRLFGLTAWAGRVPLLSWSLLGLGAFYLAIRRLLGTRAALYGAVVLATTPLFFLQARALLGDAVTLAAFTSAWSLLAAACLAELSIAERVGFAWFGSLSLYAGFWCRGPILGVAVPALSVGIAGILQRSPRAAARYVALGCTVVGALSLALGALALTHARDGDYSVFVGTLAQQPSALPTFDVVLGNLAHSAFPWSAVAPLALAWLTDPDTDPPKRSLAHAAGLGLALSLAASAWLAPSVGMVLPLGIGCYAVLVAGALQRLEAGHFGSSLLALLVAASAIVIGFDLHENPEKVLSGFGVSAAALPESLQASSSLLWVGGALAVAVVTVAFLFEGPRDAPRFQRAEYSRVLVGLQSVWGGNLVFALLLVEAALVGFLLLSAISERLVPLPQLDVFGSFSRQLVAAAAMVVPLAPLLVLGAMLVRDAARWLLVHSRVTRAEGFALAFAGLGGVASLGFYPALSAQLSPTQAFETYRARARPQEPLAVLGQRSEAARYQGARSAVSFDVPQLAFSWLSAEPVDERRWLVLRKADLPELNALYRDVHRRNLPLLDARSSEIMLGVSRLRAGERSQSPLDAIVLGEPPLVQHPLQVQLGEELEALGWAVQTPEGAPVDFVVPERPFRFVIYWRVLAPITATWQAFVHIDGLQRRFNADHDLLDGRYPLRYWQADDVLVDATELRLEPNFSPGRYRVYFGLFAGERRFPVTKGPAEDDRIEAGTLQVR